MTVTGGASGVVRPFVASLRSRPGVIGLHRAGESFLTLRVEMPEVWDTVCIEAAPATPVRLVKQAALDALYPNVADPTTVVVKLNGWEVKDESASVAAVGGLDGSTFLLTFRLKRPVRA